MSSVDPGWAAPDPAAVHPASEHAVPRQRPQRVAYVLAVVLPLVLIAGLAAPAAFALWVLPRLRGPGPTVVQPIGDPVDGSAGLGDPYYPNAGNDGYDVLRYRLDLDWDPEKEELAGTAVISARATSSLKSFFVDLALDADRVTVDGRAAASSRRGFADLRIVPSRVIGAGDTFEVGIDYAGRPGSITHGDVRPWWTSGQEWIAAGEPESAAWWFPSNDHPRDPALMDVSIRVPAGMQAISTGALLSKDTGDEEKFDTWHWVTRQPVVSYATFIALGRYELREGTDAGLPYVYAVSEQLSAEDRRQAFTTLLRSGERVRILEQMFGPYPFTELGGVVPIHRLRFEGLETQTRPIYVSRGILNDDFNIELIDHELAHMWFGDHVTLKQWDDIFTSEAYASWAAWATVERTGGRSADAMLNGYYDRTKDAAQFWRVTMIDPSRDHLFDTVYVRGPMALQALRNVIGDEAFLGLSRAWAQTPGSRSLEEFMTLAQTRTTTDLGPFFRAWIYADTAPARTAENGFR